ncbi:MAG: nucleotidyltransferase [Bacteroidia bacterium]|nr:nucleotidyltransferase [Bacteroidia bacterium]
MKNTIKIINKLKKEGLIKDYAIGGAIGVIRWTEPFFTRDLDLFIILIQEPKDKEIIFLYPIYDYLEKIGYNKWTGQWIIVAGVPVEFIPAEGLSKEAVENAQETEYDGVKTKVITPEYLISLLLKAGRDKDKIKIKMLLEQAKIDMDKLKVILNKYNLNKKFQLFIND